MATSDEQQAGTISPSVRVPSRTKQPSMFMSIVQDSAFGHLVRFVTRGRYFQFLDERDPQIWKKFVNEKKSGYLAHHGTAESEGKDNSDSESIRGIGGVRTREDGDGLEKGSDRDSEDRTRVPEGVNRASGVRVDPEKGKDMHLVDWLENDPENPVNWSTGKKFFVTFEICFLTTSVYIGSAIYSPGEQSLAESFGVASVPATLGLTLFVAGYGLGPMLWSPLSEIPQIGRNPIYIGTLFVFVMFQIPTALAKNFGMFLAFRFLTGFFGSPVLATGGASISDMYAPKQRAYAIGIWGISAVSGPTLGPLVGGFAAQSEGWTWTIWELMWLSGFCLVGLFFLLPETSANNILYRRTKRLRQRTGDQKLICQPELVSESMTGREIAMIALVRPITLNFTEPMVFLLNLYIALIYGLLYIWFESFPIVFVQLYGFNLGELGLAFLGIFVGALITVGPFFWYLKKFQEPKFDDNGNIQPEYRLPAAFVGAFCIPICLFWFGWTSRASVHWIVPIIGSGFFSVGAFCLFNSVLNYLQDAYPEYAASVLAGNDLFRSSFGASFPLFAAAMYHRLGVAWASSLLGFLSLLFIPIPFALYKYGERLRKNHSQYARKDI